MIHGNLLKEPISGNDVIIVEMDILKNMIDIDILNNIDNILYGKWLSNDCNKIYNYKFNIIPFYSLGNDKGVLLGFKPDYIKIYNDEIIFRRNVIVGIYKGKLSKTDLYTSLIGLNILEGERENEFVTSA